MKKFDGKTWSFIEEPEKLRGYEGYVDLIYTTPEDHLWVGHRNEGAFFYGGREWTQYDLQDGLADNDINGLVQTDDGSVWAAQRYQPF